MSKYNITIHYRWQAQLVLALACSVLVASVFSWQAEVMYYQPYLQAFVVLIICCVGVKTSFALSRQPKKILINLDEKGNWQWLSQTSGTEWCLSGKSRVGWGFVWLILYDKQQIKKPQSHCLYHFQFSPRHLRQLCRVILQLQSNGSQCAKGIK